MKKTEPLASTELPSADQKTIAPHPKTPFVQLTHRNFAARLTNPNPENRDRTIGSLFERSVEMQNQV